ncbi:hypothetical protein CARUB_v10012304mg [Capsella rubella]|uniref:histone acetyltransferase n=1 Tax=Capsella rubella TaxID=81985 RepID=R0IQ15_9BRAS|nr:hypothetical protein CARUB_v10012304mg [Capsella rubella]
MKTIPQSSVAVSASAPQQLATSDLSKLRNVMRLKILAFLAPRIKTSGSESDKAANYQKRAKQYTVFVDDILWSNAQSLKDYADQNTLKARCDNVVRRCLLRPPPNAATPSSVAMMNGCVTATRPLDTFQSGCPPPVTCTNGVSAGFSFGTDHMQMQQYSASAGANNFNHQMVDIYRPNVNQFTCGVSSPLITGAGFSSNCGVPLPNGPMASQELFTTPTHLSALSQPFPQPPDQSNMHRYSMSNVASFGTTNPYGVVMPSVSMAVSQHSVPWNSNPMLQGVDSTVTSNLQGMQQYPLPKRQLHQALWNNQFQSASTNQDHLAHGFHQQAPDTDHQGLHSQNLYSGQLDKDAYLTQQAMGLAAPVINNGPSLDSYEEALHRQVTTNGFKPSKLQCQQAAVKDHYIGAQSASVHGSQMNSSPFFQPRPQQQQSASVPVQRRQPSLQKSTGISENYDGQRGHTVVNLCQSSAMQPEPVHRLSSPIPHISSQTVSPRNTVESKHLGDGNGTTPVNGDCGQAHKNVQRWLVFMIHVRKCKARKDKCATEYCFQGKKMWKHICFCKLPDCTYSYCLPTRKWIHHYKKCGQKTCTVCGYVKNYKEKNKEISVALRRAKYSSGSSKCQPRKSSKSRQACKKGGAEAPSVDADLQPSVKRRKVQRPSQNAIPVTKNISVTGSGVVCKPHSSMNMKKKNGLKSDDCKSVRPVVMPMDIDVPDACGIPVTRELEKQVAEDTPKGINCGGFTKDDKTSCLLAQGKSKCMNEVSASKEEGKSKCMNEVSAPKEEENVKQSVEVVDASKMEISSLVELFSPEQVKGHIRSLRQWVGQSKTKADKNKAMGCTMSENSCQLCAVERLVFEPIPVYCSPCGVRIKKNALHYYCVVAGESRHYVCSPCYNEAHENLVSLDGTSIPKASLEKKKNDEQVGEGWVQCDKCEAWQHQICALFNSRRNHGEATKYTCPNCYIQELEQGERRPLPPSAIPGAKDLPVTALSNHIEERLFKKLKEERQERARLQGKFFEEVPGAESLTVRVVASVDRVVEVKESFLEIFREENYPSEFPYKSKVILLFQEIENVEVCLFGMFVQEFGTECGPPNQRPEVRTVSGEALRTFVYHEILIGYLDYCKKRGFTSCYIWACPPIKGEDYILYCHPEIQKTPKNDKLREWYLAMLRKAAKEDVVVECTNFYDHFFVQSGECRANVTAARLPYFDGDYWPGAAEDLIRQMNQEGDGAVPNRKGLTKKVISKRALRAFGQLDLSVNASKDRLMMQKLGETICPMKEDFIMVHLQHCCKHCSTLMVSGNRWVCNQCKNFQICDKCNEVEQNRIEKERHPINHKEKHTLFPMAIEDVPAEIKDKDDNLESEFFDNRQSFLNLCQGNNYQYDTLRRAKHSSMMILYHLHNPTAPAFATFCTICQQEVESSQGWHCEVCPNYDVCSACYSNASINHSHKLISRSSSADTSAVQHNRQTNQNYQAVMKKVKELLLHMAACRSTTLCKYHGCRKMKLLSRHSLACKTGPGGCPYCKRFWSILRLHARSCRDSQCTVTKCRELRDISSRQQQQSDKRRRAAVIEMMRERAAEASRTR